MNNSLKTRAESVVAEPATRRARRAQVAVEYLAVIGLTLAALVFVWLYVSSSAQSTRDDLNVDYARQIVLKIAHAADLVYAQGPPAQFVVEVNVPDGVEEASVSGQEILLKMRVGNALTDVHAATVGNLTGNISIMQYNPGLVPVTVKAQRLEVGSVVVNVTV